MRRGLPHVATTPTCPPVRSRGCRNPPPQPVLSATLAGVPTEERSDDYRAGVAAEHARVEKQLRKIVSGHLYAAAGRVLANAGHYECGRAVADYASRVEDGDVPVLPIGTWLEL